MKKFFKILKYCGNPTDIRGVDINNHPNDCSRLKRWRKPIGNPPCPQNWSNGVGILIWQYKRWPIIRVYNPMTTVTDDIREASGLWYDGLNEKKRKSKGTKIPRPLSNLPSICYTRNLPVFVYKFGGQSGVRFFWMRSWLGTVITGESPPISENQTKN